MSKESSYPAHDKLSQDLKRYGPKDVYWLKGRLNGTLCEEFNALQSRLNQLEEVNIKER